MELVKLMETVEWLRKSLPPDQQGIPDDVFGDMLEEIGIEEKGVASEIFLTYRVSCDKTAVEHMFQITTGVDLSDYLMECMRRIVKKLPHSEKQEFKYMGLTFTPVKAFPFGMDFRELGKHLYTEPEINRRLQESQNHLKKWNYHDFYAACKDFEMRIFYCEETGKLYFPMENELFGWKENGYERNECK